MSGHIVAIFSGKGGVGKSTLSMNLAIAFEKYLKLKTCVIDFDLENFGDQELIIGTRSNKYFTDLCKSGNRLEDELLKQHLVKYSQGGISLLNLAGTKADLEYLSDDGIEKTLNILTRLFKIIVVDCGSTILNPTIKLFEKSSGIYLVTEQDMLTINATKRALRDLNAYSFMPEVVKPILNKYHDSRIGRTSIQKQLNIPLIAVIPTEKNIGESIIQANPMVLASSKSPYSQAVFKLASDLVNKGILQKTRSFIKPALRKKSSVIGDLSRKKDDQGQGFRRNVNVSPETVERNLFKGKILKKLIETMDLKEFDPIKKDPKEIIVFQEKAKRAIVDLLDKTPSPFNKPENRAKLIKELLDESLRLGPLEDLLADPEVSEIMVNGVNQVYIERNGKLTLSDVTFVNEEQLLTIIERIVEPLGRRIDEKTPYVDARLKGGVAAGSRVHAIIPPLAIDGPTITIRKFKRDALTYKSLVEFGTVSKEMVEFLRICVKNKRNIIISGGTGSGKTTLLNVMSSFIPNDDRIITVEDAAELQLTQDHVARLETKGPSIEGTGEITIRDLVKQTLRMRPDRIIVGECRGGEALDMLQAMNTGHDGSLTTIHANNPREAIGRLETLVMMSGIPLPSKAIKNQISSAIHIIVQQKRYPDGSRKVSEISEITGMEGDTITMQPIFGFKESGLDSRYNVVGKFLATGFIPKFIEDIEKRGRKIPRGIFTGKG